MADHVAERNADRDRPATRFANDLSRDVVGRAHHGRFAGDGLGFGRLVAGSSRARAAWCSAQKRA
jgi:hypothetical protein